MRHGFVSSPLLLISFLPFLVQIMLDPYPKVGGLTSDELFEMPPTEPPSRVVVCLLLSRGNIFSL